MKSTDVPEPGPAATDDVASDADDAADVVSSLLPIVRRVVSARVSDAATVDDLVQETLARVLAAAGRVEPGMLEPYAIVTARHVVASLWREQDRHRRNRHRVLDLDAPDVPDEGVVAREEQAAVAAALGQLSEKDRHALLEHEVSGRDTRTLAEELGSTAGAVAAQLNRARARLRVEYLLAMDGREPPTERCRPVLLALSGGDRRRQLEVDVEGHLLDCRFCAELSEPLVERSPSRADETRIPIRSDADIVAARQAARDTAARVAFSRTDLTLIATAVSEVARNIVRFASSGEIVVALVDSPREGVRIAARDTGPGIPDVEKALTDGYSTYNGLGLGLPGARRLMDEFAVDSEPGRGTTVTMTKWRGVR